MSILTPRIASQRLLALLCLEMGTQMAMFVFCAMESPHVKRYRQPQPEPYWSSAHRLETHQGEGEDGRIKTECRCNAMRCDAIVTSDKTPASPRDVADAQHEVSQPCR
jgi:hypothetical protein